MSAGATEAQTLAISLKGLKPDYPLPLDLFEEASNKFGFKISEVVIDDLIDDIYTAKIIVTQNNKVIEFKARPIDAATIAVKNRCPIYVSSKLLP